MQQVITNSLFLAAPCIKKGKKSVTAPVSSLPICIVLPLRCTGLAYNWLEVRKGNPLCYLLLILTMSMLDKTWTWSPHPTRDNSEEFGHPILRSLLYAYMLLYQPDTYCCILLTLYIHSHYFICPIV